MKGYGTRSLIPLALVAALLLVACRSASTSPVPTSPGTGAGFKPAPTERPRSTTEVRLPRDFDIEAYRGEEVLGGKKAQFSHLFGQGQPVVLNFFAGLCPPCRAEMPDFQSVSAQYQGRVTIFGLDIGPFVQLGSREDGQALVQELGITYPTGTTFEPNVVRAYQVLGMPTTVFLTPDGQVFKRTNFLTRATLVEIIEELLRASRT